MKEDKKSINELVIEFFKTHSNQDLAHGLVVDWVEEQYFKLHNRKPRDTWRAIRKLHQDGFLIKVKKGVYRYDPKLLQNRNIDDFSLELKKLILKRDNYRCVICGRTAKEGYELHVDHILPKDKGRKGNVRKWADIMFYMQFQKKEL